jgi:L-fuculose-phosphate aldolase
MLLEDERRQVVAYCRKLRSDGLVVGTSGNISVRARELLAVSPSGLGYDEMTAEMVGVHRLDGQPVEAALAPTTELPMHLTVYEHTDAQAVVHTHSTAATAVSTLVEELPPVHYLIALFGGPVRVAEYATYGTPELARAVRVALEGRTGCLLANHGALTCGATLAQAYAGATHLEWLCDVYLRAVTAGGPRLLPVEEVERVRQKLASYGAQPYGADRTKPADR